MRDLRPVRFGPDVYRVPVKNATYNLTHLDISMASYPVPNVSAEILERCHSLKALSLELGKLDRRGCLGIAQNSGLEILNLAMCEGLDAEGLKAILLSCKT